MRFLLYQSRMSRTREVTIDLLIQLDVVRKRLGYVHFCGSISNAFFCVYFVRDSLVRRSGRTKVAPLKFWMNEKVVYSKTREGPVIKSVIRAASEEAQEKPKRKPRRESKPLPVRQQRAAKEKKVKEKKEKDKGKEDEQEDEQEEGEESGQDRALEKDKHDSIDVNEDQTESSTGFREDPRVTADIIVFGTDDVVSKGKLMALFCFVLV